MSKNDKKINENVEEVESEIQVENEVKEEVKVETDKQLDDFARKVGIDLESTELVKIKIPVSELNPHDLVVPVGINGYFYQIPRGIDVLVPIEVQRILLEAVPPFI